MTTRVKRTELWKWLRDNEVTLRGFARETRLTYKTIWRVAHGYPCKPQTADIIFNATRREVPWNQMLRGMQN